MQEVGAKEPLLRPSTPLHSSATLQVGGDCINSIQVYLLRFNLDICGNMHQHQLRINTRSWCRINSMKSLSSSLNNNYQGRCLAWGWFQFHRICNFQQQHLRCNINKVSRCLARYSLRAKTTNQPTNRTPNEPGPTWPKMPISGQFCYFCYPHNRKPT